MFGPCQLILVFTVEPNAAGLDGTGEQVRIERQINSILNFVFLGLAQIAAKEDLFDPAFGKTVE